MIKTIPKIYLYAAIAAVILYVWITKFGGARFLGSSAVGAAGDLAVGAVEGAGGIVGIPVTSADKCAKAIADRDYWGVSAHCPALTFLKYNKDSLFASSLFQGIRPANTSISHTASATPSVPNSVTNTPGCC